MMIKSKKAVFAVFLCGGSHEVDFGKKSQCGTWWNTESTSPILASVFTLAPASIEIIFLDYNA